MKIAAVKFPFYVVGTVPGIGRVGHCIHAVDEEAAQARFRRAHPGVVKFHSTEIRNTTEVEA